MIISYDNDSLIFDMHIMMKMISRYYHSIITQISIKYQNINSQTNNILSRYFDKPQRCTLVPLQDSRDLWLRHLGSGLGYVDWTGFQASSTNNFFLRAVIWQDI